MFLIGSRALERSLKLPSWRRPADYDLMASPIEVEQLFNANRDIKPHESKQFPGKWSFTFEGARFEIDATDNASRNLISAFKDNFIAGSVDTPIGSAFYVKPSTCYVFKRSHAGVPIHIEKTLSDLIFLSEYFLGSEMIKNDYSFLNSFEKVLLKELTFEAEERDKIRKARINFNKDKNEFFKPAEHLRQYEHDKIHDVTCRWPKTGPLYRENLVDPNKALINKKQFGNRSLEYQLTMAQEEAMVIGIERFWLNRRELPAQQVYKLGMTKLISSLSKGSFQNFCLDHIHLLKKPMWNYLERFKIAESEGMFND